MSNIIKPEELVPATLTAWRTRLGYSKRQAAEVLGCSRDAWSGWESGDQPNIPRYIGLAMAAIALGMTPYGDNRPMQKAS
jgi:transcriptional regulator with XRE-family HTH domain